MSSGAPDRKETPAPLVAPVVLPTKQSRCIVTIDVIYNRHRNGFAYMTVGFPLSSVKWTFRTDQPNHAGKQKPFGEMILFSPEKPLAQ